MAEPRTVGAIGGMGGRSNATLRRNGMDFKWPFPTKQRPRPLFRLRSEIVARLVATGSKLWFAMNRVQVHNKDVFFRHQMNRTKPLITACNHYTNIDDPFIWGIVKWRQALFPLPHHLRYTIAAHDVAFRRNIYVPFFAAGRNVPIVRGDGVYQKGIDFVIEKMEKENAWVHMFPEGGVNMDHSRKRIKWGTARMMMDTANRPNVLPFWVVGSDEVLNPGKRPYIPKIGKKVTIYFDEKPLEYEEELEELQKDESLGFIDIRKILSDKLQKRLFQLRDITEELHSKR